MVFILTFAFMSISIEADMRGHGGRGEGDIVQVPQVPDSNYDGNYYSWNYNGNYDGNYEIITTTDDTSQTNNNVFPCGHMGTIWFDDWDYRVPITLDGLEGSENIIEIPASSISVPDGYSYEALGPGNLKAVDGDTELPMAVEDWSDPNNPTM